MLLVPEPLSIEKARPLIWSQYEPCLYTLSYSCVFDFIHTFTTFSKFSRQQLEFSFVFQKEKLYKTWAKRLRKIWRRKWHRIIAFWTVWIVATIIVATAITTDYINWDRLNRDFVSSNELSRAFLASAILVMDLLIVMQVCTMLICNWSAQIIDICSVFLIST